MKFSLLSSLSLAALAFAAPSEKRSVSAADLAKLKHYAQWTAAASCNVPSTPGAKITCGNNECDTLQDHNATVVGSVIGTVLDTRGFVGIDHVDKVIVLSFQGSVSLRTWIVDFIFAQIPCDLTFGCLVHTGFFASWLEIASSATALVKQAKAANPTYQVVATGYSLGAAVSTIGAGYLRKDGIPVDLITYGSPRVGNNAFAKFITNQAGLEMRATHKDDPVARLPPIIFNYRHTSPEYWFDEGSDGIVTTDEVKVCTGHANIACNGGTTGFDLTVHEFYFQGLVSCRPAEMPFKARAAGTLNDAEIAEQLNKWVALDRELVKTLPAGEK
ncbi:Alpha/Beta hydrolase protein [Podospora fimiseda]|uniref:Alpha/Beta hydrolase protein n=1 Tax=Podospora fimiseda TaxID=252190 RepID=A0AAN7GSI0_9PEZI|nr:Alpha/Beta hydrolase protein [Podospora fimiseda]